MELKYILKGIYLDWLAKHYITIGLFAECHGLTEANAKKLLEVCLDVYDASKGEVI